MFADSLLLSAVAAVVAVAALEAAATFRWERRWTERGVLGAAGSRAVRVGRAGAGVLLGVVAALTGAAAYAPAVAVLAWYVVVANAADVKVLRVPREPALWLWLVGTACAGLVSPVLLALSALLVLTVVLALAVTALIARGGLGMGDMRLLVASAPLLVALPQPEMALLATVASATLIQLVVRPLWKRAGISESGGYPFVPALTAGMLVGAVVGAFPA